MECNSLYEIKVTINLVMQLDDRYNLKILCSKIMAIHNSVSLWFNYTCATIPCTLMSCIQCQNIVSIVHLWSPTPHTICLVEGKLKCQQTLLNWWVVYGCPDFIFGPKHQDFSIQRLYSRIYYGAHEHISSTE